MISNTAVSLFFSIILFLNLFSVMKSEEYQQCCEQHNIPGAKIIKTTENVDYENVLVEHERQIQTASHGNLTVKVLIGPRRVEILNFISEEEIATANELYDSFNEQEYDIVYPGFDNVRGPQQFYPTKALYRSAMYESGEMTPAMIKKLYEDNMRLERLNKFYFKLLERTIDAAQTYFNESELVLKDSFIVRRYQPGNKQPALYPGCNITNWGHHPHVDRCTHTLDDINGRTCAPYSLLPVEYSCMIYLNDVDGGELVFLNMPQGKDALIKTMEERVKEMNEGGGSSGPDGSNFRHRNLRNLTSISPTNFVSESYVPIYELPVGASKEELRVLKKRKLEEVKKTKYDIGGQDLRPFFKPMTTDYVSVKRGNILCFKSTPENLHGVNEVRNGVRKNISFFMATKKLYDEWARTGRMRRMQGQSQQRGGGQYDSPEQPQQQQQQKQQQSHKKSSGGSSKSSKKKATAHKSHSRE
jgi:hypothetical protein